jgi:hypothetical protein
MAKTLFTDLFHRSLAFEWEAALDSVLPIETENGRIGIGLK